MPNVLKHAQRFIFVIPPFICLSYPGVFSPLYAKSEPLLLLLSGAAMFIVAAAFKRVSSREEAGGDKSNSQ